MSELDRNMLDLMPLGQAGIEVADMRQALAQRYGAMNCPTSAEVTAAFIRLERQGRVRVSSGRRRGHDYCIWRRAS